MAGNQGTQDWFYHAPAQRKDECSPVDYPAPSHIPIGSCVMVDEREEDTGMKRGWIRDTDSKYVRLSKMGGRKDLLRFREPCSMPTEAKDYPRVEWFDHVEDKQPENTGSRKIFLPEYMVHEEYKPELHVDEQATTRRPLGRPPFSLHDKLSAFKRDGDLITDKTIKLPEVAAFPRKPMVNKKKDRQLKAALKQQTNQKKELSRQRQRYPTVDMSPPRDKAKIGKLLSMGYQMDWYNQRERYNDECKKILEKQPKWEQTKTELKPTTEYRDYINKQNAPREANPAGKTKPKKSERRNSIERAGLIGVTKGLFKLSKFEKASPKVDSHWTQSLGKDKQLLPVDTYVQQLDMPIDTYEKQLNMHCSS